MLNIFKKKPGNFVGIDLGTASIKLVELSGKEGEPRLVTYGIAERSGDIVRNNSAEEINTVIGLLQRLKKEARVTTINAIAALPPFSVFSSILSLPQMPKKEIAQAVKWEAKKFVPMPLEEMILDWKLLRSMESEGKKKTNVNDKEFSSERTGGDAADKTKEQPTTSGKSVKKDLRVLITAAPKNLVSRYIEIFRKAGFNLLSLETESFALARSLLFGTRNPVMIIDIGALVTSISIIEGGIPILNRSLDVGGATLTRAIATSLNIDQARAEQFKRDIGVVEGGSGGSIPKIIEQTLNPILNEVKYSLSLYQSQTAQGVEKVLVVGGSSYLPHLSEYLARVLNLNVYLSDPWFKVAYPVELKSVLEEIGARLAVSIGLALRDLE